jgi:hypothetical protein
MTTKSGGMHVQCTSLLLLLGTLYFISSTAQCMCMQAARRARDMSSVVPVLAGWGARAGIVARAATTLPPLQWTSTCGEDARARAVWAAWQQCH